MILAEISEIIKSWRLLNHNQRKSPFGIISYLLLEFGVQTFDISDRK